MQCLGEEQARLVAIGVDGPLKLEIAMIAVRGRVFAMIYLL
jgi:hypothetical protein